MYVITEMKVVIETEIRTAGYFGKNFLVSTIIDIADIPIINIGEWVLLIAADKTFIIVS